VAGSDPKIHHRTACKASRPLSFPATYVRAGNAPLAAFGAIFHQQQHSQHRSVGETCEPVWYSPVTIWAAL